MRLSESLQFIPMIETEAYGGAGVDSDAIDMSRFHTVSFIFAFGDLTGDSTLTLYPGSTAAIAVAKSETSFGFNYRLAAADAGATLADTFGNETAVAAAASLTLTAATYDHKLLLVEIDCDQLTSDYRYLVWSVSSTANPLDLSCVAIGAPRYAGHTHPTSL